MTTVFAVIFVFGLLIIGHEFGHYIVARLSNIKIMEFSFGMGPRIIKFGKGETEYSWRAFPIGGFVKMMGEEEQVNDIRSFSCKSTPVRMSVIAAGPFMNLIISIIIFAAISMTVGYVKPVVYDFAKPSVANSNIIYPAKAAGVQIGDKLYKVNDQRISTYEDFMMYMMQNGGKTVKLQLNRQGKMINVSITPVFDSIENRYMIGIQPLQGRASLIEGVQYGVLNTWTFIKQIVFSLKSLIVGKASTEDISGPVGIIKFTGEAAKQGFSSLLIFTAFLSINLAMMNLIPFPALDGGWLLMILIEGIRKKRLDADKVGVINFIGFAFLMILTILVTFKDFIRLNIF